MSLVETNYTIDGKTVSYQINNDGYGIYLDGILWIKQYEPYIPDHSKSYEENALAQIKEIYDSSTAEPTPSQEERIEALEEENKTLNNQITDLQLAIVEIYETAEV